MAGRLCTNHPGGGGTLGISGWGCAAGPLEPLTYTRASSAEFCYPILAHTYIAHIWQYPPPGLIIYMTTVAKLGKKAADETNEKLYGQSCFRLRGNQALNSKALKFSMTRKSLANLILSFSG